MLTWSEPMPPSKNFAYDHVVAKTPLGPILIEWKSWKRYDAHCAEMPWGEFCSADDLDDAKAKVQAAWDRKVAEMAVLTSQIALAPAQPSTEMEPRMARIYLMCARKCWWHKTEGWSEVAWERFDLVECGIYEKPIADLAGDDVEFWENYREIPEGWINPARDPRVVSRHVDTGIAGARDALDRGDV